MTTHLYIDALTPAEIAVVERRMRKDGSSSAGFLGKGESLRDVIERDAATVARHGATHYELSRWLDDLFSQIPTFGRSAKRFPGYEAIGMVWRGSQECPFGGYACGMTNIDYRFTRLVEGGTLSISGLLPHLIGTHQFFEGDTPYRLDPETLFTLRKRIDG